MTLQLKGQDDILMNPLRGEIFMLSNYVASSISSGSRRNSGPPISGEEYTISRMFWYVPCQLFIVSKILVGPPPESAAVTGPHLPDCIVVVSGLRATVTDSQLKKECIETIGRPKFIYMHVSDGKTGMFSGTAVIEFFEVSHATKAISVSVSSCPTRSVNPQEFSYLTEGEWPMLEYGPPRGVFLDQPPATSARWAQPDRPMARNPWQR